MPMSTTSSVVSTSPLLPPARNESQSQVQIKRTGPNVVRFPIHPQPANIKGGQLPISKSRIQSPNVRCSVAWNSRMAASAGQTQTLTREDRTITITPGKSPKLDDSGPGFPPGSDRGDGGGGGGGGNFSGGLTLLGILGILDILKDIESEWHRKDKGRRHLLDNELEN